jgi:hypothetical protein
MTLRLSANESAIYCFAAALRYAHNMVIALPSRTAYIWASP